MYLHRPFFQWVQRVAPKRVSVIGSRPAVPPSFAAPCWSNFSSGKSRLAVKLPHTWFVSDCRKHRILMSKRHLQGASP